MPKNIWRYIFLLLTILIGVALYIYFKPTSQQDLDEYKQIVKQADTYYDQNLYAQALYNYTLATEKVSSEYDAFAGIVKVLGDKGQNNQALEIIEKSTGKLSLSDRSKLYTLLANRYYELGDYKSAQDIYTKAILGVDNKPARLGLAKTYIKRGEIDKVEKYLELKDTSSSQYFESKLINAFLKLTNTTQAKNEIKDLKETVVSDDENVVAIHDSYLAALNSVGDDKLFASAYLSGEFINAGYPYLAIKSLEPIKEEMVDYPDGLYFLGRAYFDFGNHSSAVDVLNDALNLGSYTSEIYTLLAKAQYIQGDLDLAISSFEKAVTFSTSTEKDGIVYAYVDMLLSEEQYSKAKSAIALADQDEFETQMRLTEISYAQREFGKMQLYLSKIEKLTMTDLQKKEYLAQKIVYETENDQIALARESLKELSDLDRNNPQYYLLLGKLEMSENNVDQAKVAFEKALDLDLVGDVTNSARKLLAAIK